MSEENLGNPLVVAQAAKNVTKNIPAPLLWAGGLLLVNFLVLKPLRAIFGESAEIANTEKQIDRDVRSQSTNDGSTRSQISPTVAKSIADAQWSAMQQPGTNETELFRTLNGLNGKDLLQVFSEFGVRHYNTAFGIGSGSLFGDPLNLFGWYAEELGTNDLQRMRSIWAKSGLNF